MKLGKFSYEQTDLVRAKVMIDGEDISNYVNRVSFDAEPGQLPVVEVGLVAVEVTNVFEKAEIRLGRGVRELLIKYGWTPPADGTGLE